MKKPDFSPSKAADHVVNGYLGIGSDPESQRTAIRRLLSGAVQIAIFIPLFFYLKFGELNAFAWGFTVFLVMLCLLFAFGLYFQNRPEYHTRVQLIGDWADRLGSFWLVSCAAGPLLGWMVTSAFEVTAENWETLYWWRASLAIGAPVITALPCLRYLDRHSIRVLLPLLVIVTLLPVSTAFNVSRDLWDGPLVRPSETGNAVELYLLHTERNLGEIESAGF